MATAPASDFNLRAHTRAYCEKDNRLAALSYFGTFAVYFASLFLAITNVHLWWILAPMVLVHSLSAVRLYVLQHDTGHHSLFATRAQNELAGHVLSPFTFAPFEVMKQNHNLHHANIGNLDHRETGEIHTMTLREWHAAGMWQRLFYRLYRNPVVLFGLGPSYLFFVQNRVPLGLMAQTRYWLSAMGTNLTILAALAVIFYFGGIMPILLIFVPSTLLAATAGMWLFYVQHQFETTHWEENEAWDLHDAAFHGSSHYILPRPLQWLSANIGIHHVHHLYSRIPFYRLPEVLRDHVALAEGNRMTIRESLANARLHLWDEKSKRLLSFAQARRAV